MPIEWNEFTTLVSDMTANVVDAGAAPSTIIAKSDAFKIKVRFVVPAPVQAGVNPSHKFRLRAFAESIGPGQEKQIGPDVTVDGEFAAGDHDYQGVIDVPANTLLGEGDLDPAGAEVSGMYTVIVVMQHKNGTELRNSGYAEIPNLLIRKP